MDDQTELKNWLKNLKPGDEVAEAIGTYGRDGRYVISVVDKVTKAHGGTIWVNGAQFRQEDGVQRVGHTYDARGHIEPLTDLIREGIKRRLMMKRIRVHIAKAGSLEAVDTSALQLIYEQLKVVGVIPKSTVQKVAESAKKRG